MGVDNLPVEFLKENQIVPSEDGKVFITKKTPFYAVEDIRFLTGKTPETVLISEEEFNEKLEEYISNIQNSLEEETEIKETFFEDLLVGSDAPVIQMLNSLFLKAVRSDASDIHFEPFSDRVVVRFRLDGVLHEVSTIPLNAYPQVVSRIKIISKLNVAEKRLPQDGRIKVKIGEKKLDMRVSTLPTVFGERVVIRLLDRSDTLLTLEELGFEPDDLEKYERIIRKPHGLVLVTGPTGSGKSTTLYASLLKLKTPRKNIITIEDPVEYQIDGISQIQVNPKIDLTFANGLRSILRQDPDIVMVGEIRDLETAEIAIHASMTGHLVLSTLHTNDAPSAVARLVDMGVEPFLVASSLEGVIAQRLVRKICESCKKEYIPRDDEVEEINRYMGRELKIGKLYKGEGCDNCLGTGFKGRIAIYEIMEIDEEMRAVISKQPESMAVKEKALEKGMRTLIQDGLLKVVKGVTTVEEVLQVAQV
ncbi:MAG TPA: type II secretion system protein GspE [Persephonella sp.]|uniref:protein-secreting ATPase n=1 Tax=Persephonella marina (strain DSM 14350 / EX-H1) TaxID=123214 RepID=C0QPL5_PERMH|nr:MULTISPECIES: type II secretion system ATPase GspE [Persephonella]ACO03394.1 general secretion pathway protein E (Type II traffic warden ATPase)(Cholera toxin secretion protein EpsE) [Persephonella marina EX-H1]HCB69774.1 type II secretion system protein GspE [Persephonella sp.]